jgi:cytochrome c oxidase assembly protein Cox11
MKNYLSILFTLVQQISFAQVQVHNNCKTARTNFGVQKIQEAIKINKITSDKHWITIDTFNFKQKEKFTISTVQNTTTIRGNDETAILYACLELANRIKTTRSIRGIHFTDAPEMVMRGQCIGLQKSTYLPGRNVYEYPYTPETFPWFYDKKLWFLCWKTG